MSAPLVLAVGALGGLGACARLLVDGAITRRTTGDLPLGILAVNLFGAFLLGVAIGAGLDGDARRLVATGLLGAFTTFSTWMLDSRRLGPRDRALNLGVSLLAGLLAVWAGRHLGGAV